MERPLSQLIHFPFQTGTGSPIVMTLHRYNTFAGSMRDIGLAVNPDGRVLGLESTKGVYLGRNIVGYTWFVGPLTQPSPVHFGDSMLELERFFWDQIDRQETDDALLPFLVGDEQGAIMAIAMAGAVPDLLSGVVALNVDFPTVPGWEPPLAPLDGLPILLVNPVDGPSLTKTLNSWGASVTSISTPDGTLPLEDIRSWVAEQPVRTHRKEN
jgi:hypothetical protein